MADTKLTNFRIQEDEYYTFLHIAAMDMKSGNSQINEVIRKFNKDECAKRKIKPITRAAWEAAHPNQGKKGAKAATKKVVAKKVTKRKAK